MTQIAIIIGSPAPESRLFGLTQYVQEKLSHLGFQIRIVSAADLPAEDLLRANFTSPVIQQALAVIDQADGVIIASPVYKAAYSGALKTIIDLIPQKGLKSKIVFPLFIAGTISHLLAVDYALKPVIAALGGTHIVAGVFAVDQWITRIEGGGYQLSEELQHRLDVSINEWATELLIRQKGSLLNNVSEVQTAFVN